jgi:integrase
VTKGRDPAEPIQGILNLERPMSALFDMIESMRGALPPASMCAKTRAVAFRDLLLVEMLVSNPLRIGMFSIMTFRADQSGNLYRRQDGSWRIRFKAEDFKNARVRAGRPRYDVPVHWSLWPLIEEYLREHRPHLMGADGCDYLFRPSPRFAQQMSSKLPGPHAPMLPGTLSDIVRLASQTHIPKCCGFGAHAVRHINATHLIKTDPVGGWIRAAYALNDKESTVRDAYQHLKVTEEHEIWQAAYEQIRSAHESARGEFSASCADMLPVLRGFLDRGITDLRQVVADLAVRTDLRREVA